MKRFKIVMNAKFHDGCHLKMFRIRRVPKRNRRECHPRRIGIGWKSRHGTSRPWKTTQDSFRPFEKSQCRPWWRRCSFFASGSRCSIVVAVAGVPIRATRSGHAIPLRSNGISKHLDRILLQMCVYQNLYVYLRRDIASERDRSDIGARIDCSKHFYVTDSTYQCPSFYTWFRADEIDRIELSNVWTSSAECCPNFQSKTKVVGIFS